MKSVTLNVQAFRIRATTRCVLLLMLITTMPSTVMAESDYQHEFKNDDVTLTLTIDRTKLKIADPTKLTIRITGPLGMKISFPSFADILSGLETSVAESWDSIPIDQDSTRRRWIRCIEIESLRPGDFSVPRLDFSYVLPDRDDSPEVISTESINISVESSLPEKIEITEFRDIKDSVALPSASGSTNRTALTLAIVSVAAVLTGAIAVTWKRRWNHLRIDAWAEREISVVRRRAKDRVRSESELEADLSNILREYVAGRFGINAKTMSNHEMAVRLRNIPELEPETSEALTPMLEAANRAKFAGKATGHQGIEQIDRHCRLLQDFVARTRIIRAGSRQEGA